MEMLPPPHQGALICCICSTFLSTDPFFWTAIYLVTPSLNVTGSTLYPITPFLTIFIPDDPLFWLFSAAQPFNFPTSCNKNGILVICFWQLGSFFIQIFPVWQILQSCIRCRLRQLGCLIARGKHFLVWATMIYRRIVWLGKFKLKVSLHQSYHTNNKKHQKWWPNWLQTIIQHKLIFLILHTHILLFGQVKANYLKPSLPDRATKKKSKLSQLDQMFLIFRPLQEKFPWDFQGELYVLDFPGFVELCRGVINLLALKQ